MLHMLLTYGMRSGELLGIRTKDIDQGRGTVFIRGTKGSNDREFKPDRETFLRLVSELEPDPESKVFRIGYKRLQHIWYTFRPCKKGLHSLRHTVGVRVYKKKKDLLLTQQILGHKSIKTTMVYMTYVYTQEQYNEVLD